LATVITNLLSAIPFFGQDLVELIWGGFSVSNATLNRFFSLHYLLPFVLAALVVLHLMALHTNGSNNPNGYSSNDDRVGMHPYFTFKDLVTIFLFFLVLSIMVFFYPNALGHSDNYIPANPMSTPASIVPEWYLLPFYAILRSIPNKLLGVIAMFGSLLILLILPIVDFSRTRGSQFSPLKKIAFWSLVVDFAILMWIGSQHPEEPYVFIGQMATAYYFAWFLIVIPFIGIFENTIADFTFIKKNPSNILTLSIWTQIKIFFKIVRVHIKHINRELALRKIPDIPFSKLFFNGSVFYILNFSFEEPLLNKNYLVLLYLFLILALFIVGYIYYYRCAKIYLIFTKFASFSYFSNIQKIYYSIQIILNLISFAIITFKLINDLFPLFISNFFPECNIFWIDYIISIYLSILEYILYLYATYFAIYLFIQAFIYIFLSITGLTVFVFASINLSNPILCEGDKPKTLPERPEDFLPDVTPPTIANWSPSVELKDDLPEKYEKSVKATLDRWFFLPKTNISDQEFNQKPLIKRLNLGLNENRYNERKFNFLISENYNRLTANQANLIYLDNQIQTLEKRGVPGSELVKPLRERATAEYLAEIYRQRDAYYTDQKFSLLEKQRGLEQAIKEVKQK